MGMTGCYSTPEGGEVIVVRNGGPLDDKQIRQVVPNGAGNTWTGWMSEAHPYPASDQQRIYKFDDTDDADAKPVEVFTRDGVRVRLVGTFYLNTAFDNGKRGVDLVKSFDTAFGTRKFQGEHPWDEAGWPKFLNSVLQPVIDSNLREIIAEFDCKALVASCALVQRTSESVSVDEAQGKGNQSNVERIQARINQNLTSEIESKLAEPYFANIRFSLGPVTLPGVQNAIDSAQRSFAAVSSAQATEAQAKALARANIEKQRGYERCPACARIDAIKSLPRSLTALGGDFAVAVK